MESSHKAPRFKVGDRVRITKYKDIFKNIFKVTPKIGQEKHLLLSLY